MVMGSAIFFAMTILKTETPVAVHLPICNLSISQVQRSSFRKPLTLIPVVTVFVVPFIRVLFKRSRVHFTYTHELFWLLSRRVGEIFSQDLVSEVSRI